MISTFQLNEADLDARFLDALKAMFKGRNLTLVVESSDVDATEHLLSSEANRERLLRSIENVEAGRNLREFSLDELIALAPDA